MASGRIFELNLKEQMKVLVKKRYRRGITSGFWKIGLLVSFSGRQ